MPKPADDRAKLQGLWKLTSLTSRGGRVLTGVTHWQIDGDRVKEIDPGAVGRARDRRLG